MGNGEAKPQMNRLCATSLPLPQAAETRGLTTWVAPLCVAAVAALVYLVTLHGTFIYDDASVILKNWRVTHEWGKIWTTPYALRGPDRLWRPLTLLTYAIEYAIYGATAWPYHLVNIVLHAGVSAAVVALGRKIAGSRAGWIAGALFAVHPVHVEAVAGIVGRAELMCTLATLLGLRLFLGTPTPWRVGAICACFLVAVLTKEQGMLFPLLLLMMLPFRGIFPKDSPARQRDNVLLAALLLLFSAYFAWREMHIGFYWNRETLSRIANPMVMSHGRDRWLMPLVLLGRYTGMLVAPVRLSPDYGGTIIGSVARLDDPWIYLGIAAMLTWFVLAGIAVRQKAWAMLFCLLALGLTYGLTGNIVALIGTIFAERVLYLPSVFFLLLAGMWLGKWRLGVSVPLVIAATALGAVRTFTYAREWNDAASFYVWSYQHQPRSFNMYVMAYNEHKDHGDWPAARLDAYRGREALPDQGDLHQMAIEADMALGDVKAAAASYERGKREVPNYPFEFSPPRDRRYFPLVPRSAPASRPGL
ncbi:MAG: hypothetical protein JWL69_3081 [Phycisphaerales bacterium]|nr:hypothetical protein [Phycisphaerales bacterium]